MNKRPKLRAFTERLHKNIEDRNLRGAFRELSDFAREEYLHDAEEECKRLESRYYYMLRSMTQGNPDPNQREETDKMLEGVLVAGEKAVRALERNDSETLAASYARYASLRPGETIPSLAVDYLTEQSKVLSDPRALTDASLRAPLERLSRDIFHRIWVDYPLDEDSCDAVINLISEKDVPQADREAWLSAVSLGLLDGFDPRRLRVLAAASRLDETRLRAAALTGLFFALHKYYWLNFSPTLNEVLDELKEDPDFAADMRAVVFEYSRQLGADALCTRVENELLPRLNSMGAAMMQKLGGIDLSNKSPEELQSLLSGLDLPGMGDEKTRHSMQNINDMAEEGDDVFYGFLKPMHQLPFFHDVANWWMPFDTSRSEFADILDGEGALLGELFGQLGFMCDSDKYAVLMAVASAPRSMRAQSLQMMVEQYSLIAEQLGKKDEDYDARFRRDAANYIKNAFRFYRLFRRKGEFYNPFLPEWGFNSSQAVSRLYSDYDSTMAIAERLYKSGVKSFAFPFYLGALEAGLQERTSTLLRAAESAESAGYKDYALKWAEMALESNPEDEALLLYLLHLLNEHKDKRRMLELLDARGVEKLSSATTLGLYSRLLAGEHEYARAIEVVDKLLYFDKGVNVCLTKLLKAEVLLRDGNPFEAIELLEQMRSELTTDSQQLYAELLLGTAYFASHEADKAFGAFKRSLGVTGVDGLASGLAPFRKMLEGEYGLSAEEINGMIDAVHYSLKD